jgi:colanic acid/amylovoran biosynthesis glycosyltransferase
MADSIHKLGCPKDKIRIHHLGIDVSSVPFKPRVWAKGQVLKVLIASTFAEKKGIPYAIEALGGLKDDFPIEITIIGDAKNTKPGLSEKRKIIRIINDYQLHSNVKMLGLQPHSRLMEEAYKNHIFIAPSITGNDGMTEGGAPVTLIDMAATGMPIISSFHCDIPEVIRHKETGLLSKERSVTELRNNIKWFIDNPEQWDILLTAGRKHLKNEYNSPKLGNSLSYIYKEIIS